MGQSVLQDWVMELPLRHQGTLLTGVRGCDVQPKLPLEATARKLVAFLRWTFMNPADEREVGILGSFFDPDEPRGWKASELGHLPLHWYSHLMHAFEVVGYCHPDLDIRESAFEIYVRLARSLHLHIEMAEDMNERLTEDRVQMGTVVS